LGFGVSSQGLEYGFKVRITGFDGVARAIMRYLKVLLLNVQNLASVDANG
jgi:hypothetical protein